MVDRMPAAWQVHGDGLWAVELVGSGGFIGFSGFMLVDRVGRVGIEPTTEGL